MRSTQIGKGDYLIVHRYAPELNTLVRRGVEFRCAGCTTIKQARAKLFAPVTRGRVVKISWKYPEPFHSVLGTGFKAGKYIDAPYKAFSDAILYVKQQLSGSELSPISQEAYGVTHIPAPDIKITTKLIG